MQNKNEDTKENKCMNNDKILEIYLQEKFLIEIYFIFFI